MTHPALVAGSGSVLRQTPPCGGALFIFGLGCSSLAIAKAAMAEGFTVAGTTRSPEKIAALRAEGIDAFVFDAIPESALQNATHILSSVPTVEGAGDVVLPLLSAHRPPPIAHWYGYLSTTGVYGDWQGQWVDETSETRPNNARLQRRVDAENAWLARGGNVFRLAGIYGAGRSAIEDVLEGTARRIDKPDQVFSRIHAEDIAQVVVASIKTPHAAGVFNVCDDEPCAQREVVEFACELLQKPLPPLLSLEAAGLSAMGREFYSANRRVRNDKIKQQLGITLKYPSYREGLTAIAKQQGLV